VLPSELTRWFAEWVRPLHAAYYALDLPGGREAYAAANESLQLEPNPDLREAKRLRLEFTWYIVMADLGELDEKLAVYRTLLADCVKAAAGSGHASRSMARASLLLARLNADFRGIEPLSQSEFTQLVSVVPEEDRGPNFWHEVGCWAFQHHNGALLDEAYVYFTTQRLPEMADFMFSRLRLMHNLIAHTATVENVLETVNRVEVFWQFDDFSRMLLPECAAQGLVTPLVQQALHAKQIEMDQHGKRAPVRRAQR